MNMRPKTSVSDGILSSVLVVVVTVLSSLDSNP